MVSEHFPAQLIMTACWRCVHMEAALAAGGGGGGGGTLWTFFGHLAFMMALRKNLGSVDLMQPLSNLRMPSLRGFVAPGMTTCRVC